jgi:hypothetical protein
MADRLQHRQVGHGVGVGVAGPQVDAASRGLGTDGNGLVLAVAVEVQGAVVPAVGVDARPRRQDMGHAEILGQRLDDLDAR